MTATLDPKDPDDVEAEYAIDWYDELVPVAEREAAIAEGTVAQFEPDTGWLYECTTGGRTSRHYPRSVARAAGQTFADGSVVWTCRHPDDVSSIPVVQDADWDVPAGITLVSQSQLGTVTRIKLSGGTDGEDYTLTCHMTPTVGAPMDQSIVIPVRSQ